METKPNPENRMRGEVRERAPISRVREIAWSRGRHAPMHHEVYSQEPSVWVVNQWHVLAATYVPKEGIVRFSSEQPFHALSAYDRLLRDWYQEERISSLARQNRFLVDRVARLEEQVQDLQAAMSPTTQSGVSLVGEKDCMEAIETLDESLVLKAATDSAKELAWNAEFRLGAERNYLEIFVPRDGTEAIALSTLDFYQKMEEKLGVESFEKLIVDFAVLSEDDSSI